MKNLIKRTIARANAKPKSSLIIGTTTVLGVCLLAFMLIYLYQDFRTDMTIETTGGISSTTYTGKSTQPDSNPPSPQGPYPEGDKQPDKPSNPPEVYKRESKAIMERPLSKSQDSTGSKPDMDVASDAPEEASRDHPGQQVQELRASEIDDNDNWTDYLQYTRNYYGKKIHPTSLKNRTFLQFSYRDNTPAHDIEVSIQANNRTIFTGRTYPDGRIMFFPDRRHGTEITISTNATQSQAARTLPINTNLDRRIVLEKDTPLRPSQPLDVLFLLDSTGSMQDEIRRIKNTLLSISERVDQLPSNPETRFAMVSYRDRGDEYVTRLYNFEPDAIRFQRTISKVTAEGGGDSPESLNEALQVAVNESDWHSQNAVRLVFLIADAPPHLDYDQDYDYSREMVTAREKGIKIHSVATSGLDSQGEYIFRQIAQQTMGKFLFLLYPDGPTGQLTAPHNVGTDHQPETLDDLIVRLIKEELVSLNPDMYHPPPRKPEQGR